jgi:Concanavalin A-like lectin/glucanases superfamily
MMLLPTTDGHELEPPNNGNVGWSANEPYTTAFVVKSRSGGAATRHIFRSGSTSTGNHILFTTTGPVPNARHEGAGGSVTISGGSMVNDTTWHTLLTTWCPHFFGLYLDGNLVASSTAANTATSTAWSIFPVRLGLLDIPGLQWRHRADRVLRRVLDPGHDPPVERRSVRLPAPME